MLALFRRAIQLRYFIINKTHVRVFSNRNMKKKHVNKNNVIYLIACKMTRVTVHFYKLFCYNI